MGFFRPQIVRSQKGFTLIELMVTVTILSIVLSVAVPSFTSFFNMVKDNRVMSDLRTAMSVARSEAIKSGSVVSVCAANSGATACAASNKTAWESGWLVSDSAGVVLKVWADVPADYSITGVDLVEFKASGETEAGTSQNFQITSPNNESFCLTVGPVGQVREVDGSC